MRVAIFLAFALVMPACDDDAAGGNDASPTSEDLSAEVADLAMGGQSGGDGGYSTDAGGAGASCMTACDCTPGLGCFGGQCVATNNPIYCCGASPCPNGAFCENSGGGFGRCGMTGGTDLANFDHCPFVDCSNGNGTQRCLNAGCASCVAGGNGMVCSR
jgi:hypothetical protein